MGASATATDSTHGNTPLHWAIAGRNHHAISVLSEKPNVDFHAVNLNGESVINMFQNQLSSIQEQNKQRQKDADSQGKTPPPIQQFFVPRKVREKFEEEFAKTSKCSSNGSSRYSKPSNAASFAKNNYIARSISSFFKDKKVHKRKYNVYF